MKGCKKLRVIPTDINLASLEKVDMSYCSRLRIFPHLFSTKIKHVPASVAGRLSRDTKIILNYGHNHITKTPYWLMMEEGESSSSKRKAQSEGAAEVSKDSSVVQRSKKPRSLRVFAGTFGFKLTSRTEKT
uniref:Protein SUPPRESSOR OF npr1-1, CONSTITUTIVE 1 n=1 Tax=Noccaea caerulescens TaxID=107243 RepID=A0A1J3EPT3_NOCCA